MTADRVSLPTARTRNFLCVDARINGFGPFRLLVDTGTTGLVLAPQTQILAKLKSTGPTLKLRTPTGMYPVRAINLQEVTIGGLTLRHIGALLTCPEDWNGDLKVDGLIGIAAFADVVLEMDFVNGNVIAIRRGSENFPDDRSVTYESAHSEIPYVQLTLAGKTLSAMLDTGSEFAFLVPDLENYPLISLPVNDVEGVGYGRRLSPGVPVAAKRSQLDGIARLGPVVWRNPPLRRSEAGDSCRIGTGVLRKRVLVIDSRAHRLYFLEPDLEHGWPRPSAVPVSTSYPERPVKGEPQPDPYGSIFAAGRATR